MICGAKAPQIGSASPAMAQGRASESGENASSGTGERGSAVLQAAIPARSTSASATQSARDATVLLRSGSRPARGANSPFWATTTAA